MCLLGVAWMWRTSTRPRVGEDFTTLAPIEKEKRRAETKQLDAQIKDIRKSAQAKENKRFTLQISENQLNTLLQDRLDLSKFPITNLRAALDPNRLTLKGDASYRGFPAEARLAGNIEVQNGALAFKAESLEISGVPVSSLRDKAETEITKGLQKLLQEAPGKIDRVEIGDRTMTIEGITD